MQKTRRQNLALVIVVKIVVTSGWIFGCWSPPSLLAWAGIPLPQPDLFLRLLGFAYAGLLVGYAIGLRQILHGKRAAATVGTGIVSNGGSCLCLLFFGVVGHTWGNWPSIGPLIMWGSTVILAGITVGLMLWGWRELVEELRPPTGRAPATLQ